MSETTKFETRTVPALIWTPAAEVLCAPCNNVLATEDGAAVPWRKQITPTFVSVPNVRENLAQCDRCHAAVGDGDDLPRVASEWQVKTAMAVVGVNARMEQTGGMCSAAVAESKDGLRTVAVTRDDDGDYVVGVYDPGAWEEGGEAEETDLVRGLDTAIERALGHLLAVRS